MLNDLAENYKVIPFFIRKIIVKQVANFEFDTTLHQRLAVLLIDVGDYTLASKNSIHQKRNLPPSDLQNL